MSLRARAWNTFYVITFPMLRYLLSLSSPLNDSHPIYGNFAMKFSHESSSSYRGTDFFAYHLYHAETLKRSNPNKLAPVSEHRLGHMDA